MPIEANVTELNVAEALLQLRCGHRGSPANRNVPRLSPHNRMEIESAATLFFSCFTTPNTPSTSAALQSPLVNDSSRYSISSRDENSEINNYRGNNIMMTRDQGTQTEEDGGNRTLTLCEIAERDDIVKQQYERIRSLEKQLRAISQARKSPAPTKLDPDVSTDVLEIQRCNQLNNNDSYKRPKKRNPSVLESTGASARVNEVSDDEWRPEEHKPSKQSFREAPPSKGTGLVPIGEGYAMVPKRLLKQIDWSSYTGATRKLLTAVFSRRVLATHSLTGKPSPAFPGKPAKKRLEPELVNDIVQIVVERCNVPESVVRTSITTKCADESKMYRSRQQNKKKSEPHKNNQENIPPSAYDDDSSDE